MRVDCVVGDCALRLITKVDGALVTDGALVAGVEAHVMTVVAATSVLEASEIADAFTTMVVAGAQ